jgi:hypothetical protein
VQVCTLLAAVVLPFAAVCVALNLSRSAGTPIHSVVVLCVLFGLMVDLLLLLLLLLLMHW